MHPMQYTKISHHDGDMEFIINKDGTCANLPLSVVEVGHSFPICGKTADSVTACFQLHFIIKGQGTFRGEKVCGGKGFLVLPGQAQNMKVTSEDFEQYWINFNGTDVTGLLLGCGIPSESHIFDFSQDNAKYKLAVSLLEGVFPEDYDGITSLPQHSHTYLSGLLYQLLSINERETKKVVSVHEKYVSTVCSYIRSHYPDTLSVEWLSALVGLSPKYLIRIFKAVNGCTIVDYITKVRLEKAAELLVNTDKPIGEIATGVGYGDALYFSKVFAKKNGYPPSLWRKMRSKV